MKFVHIADLHFDCAFNFLTNKAELGSIRRMDQRNAFKKVIDYIKENQIRYLFISGDFYEQKTIRESTINYINSLFNEIPDTKVFITPGNHDPMIKNSFYRIYDWAKNVKIFGEKVEKIEEEEFNLYGYGFESLNITNSKINDIVLGDSSKLNILVTHASLDGLQDQNVYNPVTTRKLTEIGFDYVALGHIHKLNLETDNQSIVYPGSVCSMGFDETGKHGMVVGQIYKNEDGSVSRNIQFIELDNKEFVKMDCKIDDMQSQEELAEYINELELEINKYYEIVLVGSRSFEVDVNELYKLVQNDNVIKIKDTTRLCLDLDEIQNELSLKGLFVKKMREKLANNEIDQETFDKALEYGIESLV